jgi:hypothetical protein
MLTESADPRQADVPEVVDVVELVDDVDVCAVVEFELDELLELPHAANTGTNAAHPIAQARTTARRFRPRPISAPLIMPAGGIRAAFRAEPQHPPMSLDVRARKAGSCGSHQGGEPCGASRVACGIDSVDRGRDHRREVPDKLSTRCRFGRRPFVEWDDRPGGAPGRSRRRRT